jgi:hypothetical protein
MSFQPKKEEQEEQEEQEDGKRGKIISRNREDLQVELLWFGV